MQASLEELRARFRQGHHAEVLAATDDLLAIAAPGEAAQLHLRLLRAEVLRAGRRMAESDSELALGLAASRAAGLETEELAFQLEQARQCFYKGDIPGCEALARDALARAVRCRAALVEADTRYLLALAHSMREETTEAQREIGLALESYMAAGEDFRLAEARSVLAMLLVKQGRNFDGINLWRQALAYHENEGNTASVVEQLQRISFATWCEGDLAATRRTLQRVLGLYESNMEVNVPRSRMLTHFNLANLEMRDGNLDLAAQHYALVAEHNAAIQDKALHANLELQRAVLALLHGSAAEALRLRESAQSIAAEIGLPWSPVDAMLFALMLAASGRLADAQAEWPVGAYRRPDGEQRMALRGVLQVLEALLNRGPDMQLREQLEAWWEEVSAAELR